MLITWLIAQRIWYFVENILAKNLLTHYKNWIEDKKYSKNLYCFCEERHASVMTCSGTLQVPIWGHFVHLCARVTY